MIKAWTGPAEHRPDKETVREGGGIGGAVPWWEGDKIGPACPDGGNLAAMRLTRSKRRESV